MRFDDDAPRERVRDLAVDATDRDCGRLPTEDRRLATDMRRVLSLDARRLRRGGLPTSETRRRSRSGARILKHGDRRPCSA